ncbi:MAG: Fe-S cluster assembly protein SufD [Phycisphaeraceae bacterium]|nr:Fe-S cluster assembly protein SufD [Phycisphaeraceae bacterium]
MTPIDSTTVSDALRLESFETFARESIAQAPSWIRPLRTEQLERFVAQGLPHAKLEAWRQTNIDPLKQLALTPASTLPPAERSERLAVPEIESLDAVRLVFINGRFSEELSAIDRLPEGVTVMNLARAIEQGLPEVRKHLTQSSERDDVFAALNAAMVEDGAYIRVRRGVCSQRPIALYYLSDPGEQAVAAFPRNLIILEESSELTVVERYVGVAGSVYFNNAFTEIVQGRQANLEHYRLQEESDAAFHICGLDARLDRDAMLAAHTMLFGGQLVRNNIHPVLVGENCDCLINGLYVPTGRQHMDNHMRVEHVGTHGDSRQYYRGILADEATSVFSGRIVVAKGAQKTDAKQTNANLLLSERAHAHTQPQLEIYADDVKCTHGATVGRLEQQQLFYLLSRGIERITAEAVLIYAFAADTLERMRSDPMRELLKGELLKRLPGGDRVAGVL